VKKVPAPEFITLNKILEKMKAKTILYFSQGYDNWVEMLFFPLQKFKMIKENA